MSVKGVVQLIIIGALAIFIWKEGLPWWQRQQAAKSSAAATPDDSCVTAAAAASDMWGSGIGHFANPPYDLTAWDEFRAGVEQRARSAEGKCLCAAESCTTAKTALNDLRSLASELDGTLRSGSPPPSDLVQRQETIDNAINSARDLVRQGK
jgi:hypothetical protein